MTVHADQATVAHLFDLLRAEPAVLADLHGCIQRFQAIQDAKRQLATLDPSSIRAGLDARRDVLGGPR